MEGALRTGAGIVTLASVEPVLAAVAARLPECCLCPCEAGAGGGISPQNIEHIRRQKASVLLVGPGLGYTAQSAARAAETADMFIERVTHEIGKGRRVRVATSDGMEQVIILGHGALRVSARMFHEEVQEAEKEIRRYLQGEG